MYKIHIGARPPSTPLWSWERFLTSPRGLKSIALGAVTWGCYEVIMLGISRMHYAGREMERRDEAAFLTWSRRVAYEAHEFGAHGRLHYHEPNYHELRYPDTHRVASRGPDGGSDHSPQR